MSNLNKNWNDRADKDLFFTILSVKNIGVISGQEWTTIGNHMRSIGYGFTNEGCRQHFQGLRRAQNKADTQPPPIDNNVKKPDPTFNPITRRPGPGRGRPRKNPAPPGDGPSAVVPIAPAPSGAPGMTGPPPSGVAVSPVPVPVIPGAAALAPGQGGIPQSQMMPHTQGQMRPQAVPMPQGQQAYQVNQQGQPRPMAVGQMPGNHQSRPGAPMAPQAQMDSVPDMSALAVDPNLESSQHRVAHHQDRDEDDDDDLDRQIAKRPRLDDGSNQDDPNNQLDDEEQAVLSSLGPSGEYGQDYRQYDV
ncbi:hypothetical protein QBC38DRAFT_475252 [Podospora fimiseda]|uniref:Myb-like domain-containing protein n=1 Tax=Podospora fimiseda TaxID=252190 RepID=A0AAN7H0D1_9PEZI|nr:hypothetical protein QBC38DRAFT_475252 [Podospora fimiseda]